MVTHYTCNVNKKIAIFGCGASPIENPDLKMINQLELAKDQAERANRAKSDFLSSMSHEIRTPLNAIVGFSDCIMDAETIDEAKENAKDIVNASQTLLEIVNGILDISKIEAGKLEIVNSPYDANDTFNELAKLISPKMREKGLDFKHGTGHGVGHVLNVHEGPQSIRHNKLNPIKMKKGMITSNEPGLYIEGQYGIRHENELLCVKVDDNHLGFKAITFVPLSGLKRKRCAFPRNITHFKAAFSSFSVK